MPPKRKRKNYPCKYEEYAECIDCNGADGKKNRRHKDL
jgi:hypothetical protein